MDAEARKYLLRGTWIAVLLPMAVLFAANLADCIAFQRAISRAKNLTPAELGAIGNYSRTDKGHAGFEGKDAPEPFLMLKPIRGTFFHGHCDVLLYERDEVYLCLWAKASPSNESIIYFTNSSGPQRTVKLWDRNEEFVRRMRPTARLVTIVRWGLHEAREWVVLNDRISVFERATTVGGEDMLLASQPLTAESRASILTAIGELRVKAHGLDFRCDGVMDGITLKIFFSESGEDGPDDIVVSNVWTDYIGPLHDAVERLGPKGFPLQFREAMTDDAELRNRPCSVRTLKQMERIQSPPPRTPWWCVWRGVVAWLRVN